MGPHSSLHAVSSTRAEYKSKRFLSTPGPPPSMHLLHGIRLILALGGGFPTTQYLAFFCILVATPKT